MSQAKRPALQAVLFDLDDTLLYNNMEEVFLDAYFRALTDYARPMCDGKQLMAAMMAATRSMHDGKADGPTNEEKFARVFAPQLGKPWPELRTFFTTFYETRFPDLRVHAEAHPQARKAVETCLEAGYTVVIATNPLFPAQAIEQRLAWAGVDDMPFALVTTYENMHTCKPEPAYYLEIASRIEVPPASCLMVGNDLVRDIAPARQAGMRTFLADTWITNPDPDIKADRQGTLDELIKWLTNHKA